MSYIYEHRTNDWGALAIAHSWGNNAAVRGASSRKFTFSDLNLSRGFGPERTGPLSRALMMILRKGDIHKTRHDQDQQVAVWRHRNYKLCSVFATSMHVINKISNDESLNFLHEDKNIRPEWWDRPLIDWDELSSHASAMKHVFKATGIDYMPKVTHDRLYAIQEGSYNGLRPDQMHSLTKHIQDKYSRAYQSEADYEVRNIEESFCSLLPFTNSYVT